MGARDASAPLLACSRLPSSVASATLEGLRQTGSRYSQGEWLQPFFATAKAIMTCEPAPHAENPFTVPTKIMSRHTANKVLKDAGLPERIC